MQLCEGISKFIIGKLYQPYPDTSKTFGQINSKTYTTWKRKSFLWKYFFAHLQVPILCKSTWLRTYHTCTSTTAAFEFVARMISFFRSYWYVSTSESIQWTYEITFLHLIFLPTNFETERNLEKVTTYCHYRLKLKLMTKMYIQHK